MADENDATVTHETDESEISTVAEAIAREKALAEIRIAERKQRLEELKARAEIDKESEHFFSYLAGLPDDVIRAKVNADIALDIRKQNLEELRVEHEINLANQIEAFRQAEKLKVAEVMITADDQHWLRKYWRPVAGWTYLIICMFDFVVAPILWAVIPHFFPGSITQPWKPLTLENGGLMHISFGAILGVAAWSRGQADMLRTKVATNKLLSD